MDHVWPPELDSDARCERCGLSYNVFSTDELNCVPPGTRQPSVIEAAAPTPVPRWQPDPKMQTIVLVCYDQGAEWEETVAFGPFSDQRDAEAFAMQAERAAQPEPDCTVKAWLSTIQRVMLLDPTAPTNKEN